MSLKSRSSTPIAAPALLKLVRLWWFPTILVAGVTAYFLPGWFDIYQTLSSSIFWEQGLAFIVLAVLILVRMGMGKELTSKFPASQWRQVGLGLGLLVMADLLNAVWLKFSLVPALLAIAAMWLSWGVITRPRFWSSSWVLAILLGMCLPILERLQRFIGFPFRILSAQVVSWLLDWLGIAHVSQSTVIVTENAAASIDIPCSGVTSLYTGTLFLLALWYLEKPKVSWRLGLTVIGFYILLVAFNIWRVFSLTYIYGVLGLTAAGDALHVGIGVVGFVICCVWLWRQLQTKPGVAILPETKVVLKTISSLHQKLAIGCLVIAVLAKVWWWPQVAEPVMAPVAQTALTHQLKTNLTLQPEPITGAEATYFQSPDVVFSQKWRGQLASGRQFSVLVVGSRSARTHHDPETCQQSLGHQLNDSQILQAGPILVRELTLNQSQDALYYWYASHNEHILDYSQRVWAELQEPKRLWVLAQVGVANQAEFSDEEVTLILNEVYRGVDELVAKVEE